MVSIKSVNDSNDLVIINKSGITLRMKVADIRVMGRATQGVRLINLEKRNDEIASVCKVLSDEDEISDVDETISTENSHINETEIENIEPEEFGNDEPTDSDNNE